MADSSKPLETEPIVFNPGAYNNVLSAGFLAILLGLELLFFFSDQPAVRAQAPLRHVIFGLFALSAVLVLLGRNRIEIFPANRKIDVYKGIWPFVAKTENTLALAEKITVSWFSAQQSGRGYNAILRYSDGRTIRLQHTMDPKDLVRSKQLAETLILPIEVIAGMRYSPTDPAWAILGVTPPNPGDLV